jgi:hypothetical protein
VSELVRAILRTPTRVFARLSPTAVAIAAVWTNEATAHHRRELR